MKSGRPKRRAIPLEIMLARICREAGATVRTNVRLRDMNIQVNAKDERRLEVLAMGLPSRSGAQVAVDVTLRSALDTHGIAKPRAANDDAIVADSARKDKEGTYPELLESGRCQLVVLALEVGGRFSTESCKFIEEPAFARAARLRSAHVLASRGSVSGRA